MMIESIAGTWRFCLDETKQGIDQKWYNERLQDHIQLPGTTSEYQKANITRPKKSLT